MDKRLSWWLVIVGGVLLGSILVVLLGGLFFLLLRPAAGTAGTGLLELYGSNGERIYLTGTNSSGERIPFSGGPRWLYMHGGGCAACHGSDGRGGNPIMMGTAISSDIRYQHLLEEEEHGEREEHPPYTDALIKRAITQGLDPAGEPLDLTMPRWRLSDRDLNDLLEYLKGLDEGN